MSEADFDLPRLAAYLRMDPAEIARLVERGKIPGRRVAGQWRFSSAEIHHWLESQIESSTDDELEQMEGALSQGELPDGLQLATLLPLDAVAVPLEARTKSSVISSMVALAARSGRLWDEHKMVEAVRTREELQSTAMENGVALLHPRRPQASILESPLIALGISDSAIPFGARTRTDIFFLLCSVDDRGHLRTLARLSRILGVEEVLPRLRGASGPAEARQILIEADSQIGEA